ncbi:hypothetical protein [Terracidiphilus gabretensis]|jgi:hypothetical protein|uniref:hypothetical protein n=1 Tax=Terracidiphilus gabretensis TaxID=1577687 RepID=UPI00071BF662|nr:hypothetical protein [Terracidiphilus gabretensis]
MTPIEELAEVIRKLHGAQPTHRESVPVKETFKGETVWEGIVEVFDLIGHPRAAIVYAWKNDADHHVTALHLGPIKSAADAVRAAIVQEFRSLESAEET